MPYSEHTVGFVGIKLRIRSAGRKASASDAVYRVAELWPAPCSTGFAKGARELGAAHMRNAREGYARRALLPVCPVIPLT